MSGGRSTRSRRRAALAGVLGLTAALSVTACGNSISGRSTAAPGPALTSAAPTTAAPSTTASPGTTAAKPRVTMPPTPAAAEPDLAAVADRLRPFLLVPAEIGPGFSQGEEPRPDPSTPAICGGPGVVAQFPYALRVGAGSDGPTDGVFVQETVSVYGDTGTARAAYQANLDGLSCGQGTAPGGLVAITPAEDLSVDVPADQSTGWQLGGDGYDLVLIAVRSGELVVNFAFVVPEGQAGGLPDPLVISRAGVRKLTG